MYESPTDRDSLWIKYIHNYVNDYHKIFPCVFCVIGKYCNGTTIKPADCPTGSYCPDGTMFATQYLCPTGTFNNATSQKSQASCAQCWPGYYCAGEGLRKPSGTCDPGFYCAGGAAVKRPGDLGVLGASAANTSCYSRCVCPALNTTSGNVKN